MCGYVSCTHARSVLSIPISCAFLVQISVCSAFAVPAWLLFPDVSALYAVLAFLVSSVSVVL